MIKDAVMEDIRHFSGTSEEVVTEAGRKERGGFLSSEIGKCFHVQAAVSIFTLIA